MATVIANTVTMALHGYVEPTDTITAINDSYTYIFIAEMCIKLYALGFAGYVRDSINIFDGMIVIFSIFDLAMNKIIKLHALKSLRILRTLRVLRVTKLLRSLSFMKVIIKVISSCLVNFLNIFVLMVIFIFIFTLLGS